MSCNFWLSAFLGRVGHWTTCGVSVYTEIESHRWHGYFIAQPVTVDIGEYEGFIIKPMLWVWLVVLLFSVLWDGWPEKDSCGAWQQWSTVLVFLRYQTIQRGAWRNTCIRIFVSLVSSCKYNEKQIQYNLSYLKSIWET